MKYQTESENLKNTILKDSKFYSSVKDMLGKIRASIPEKNLLADLDNKGLINFHNTEEIVQAVENLGDGLIASGLEGSNFGIIAENSSRYVVIDMTVSSGIGISIPIDKNASEEQTSYYLEKSKANVIFCDSHFIEKIKHIIQKKRDEIREREELREAAARAEAEAEAARLKAEAEAEAARAKAETDEDVSTESETESDFDFEAESVSEPIEPDRVPRTVAEIKAEERLNSEEEINITLITTDKKVGNYLFFNELIKLGKKNPGVFFKKQLDLKAPAKIMFTPGNTGVSKAVLLSNANIIANIKNCLDVTLAVEDAKNTSLSVLPMNYPAEISTHILPRLAAGRLTYINNNSKNVVSNIKTCKPFFIALSPYIAEAIHKQMVLMAKRTGDTKKLNFKIKLSNFLRSMGFDLTHKIFAETLEPLGGNLQNLICIGATLNPKTVTFFKNLGIQTFNGYGITECGPLISMNTSSGTEVSFAGAPCPDVQVKVINPDTLSIGQIAVKSKSVFLGYYEEPRLTKKSFDENGYFLTGDSGRIDDNGNIVLAGRTQNMIKLPNGKNIFPEEIESIIQSEMPYVFESVVYMAERNKINILCASLCIKDEDKADPATVTADIEKINLKLGSYKHIDFIKIDFREFKKTIFHAIKRELMPQKVTDEEGILIS